MMRRLLYLSLIAAIATGWPAAAGAATGSGAVLSIGVAPSKLQMRLIPGQAAHAVLRAYDKSTAPVTLDVYLQDYTITSTSAVVFKPAGSLADSAAPWSTLSRTVLHVPANSYRAVRLTIRVPRNAALGTHTLAVVFRSRLVSTNSTGLRYRSAVASLMAAGVTSPTGGGLVVRGQVVGQSLTVSWPSLLSVRSPGDLWNALFHPTVHATLGVRNSGNTFFNILKGSTISFATGTGLGGRNQSLAAPTYTILPGSVRWIGAGWTAAPFLGEASVTTHLYYNHQSALSPASPPSVMIIPWNLLIVIGGLLVLLVAWRVTRSVRRGRTPRVGSPRVVWAEKSRV